jgi:hypothetical protein
LERNFDLKQNCQFLNRYHHQFSAFNTAACPDHSILLAGSFGFWLAQKTVAPLVATPTDRSKGVLLFLDFVEQHHSIITRFGKAEISN